MVGIVEGGKWWGLAWFFGLSVTRRILERVGEPAWTLEPTRWSECIKPFSSCLSPPLSLPHTHTLSPILLCPLFSKGSFVGGEGGLLRVRLKLVVPTRPPPPFFFFFLLFIMSNGAWMDGLDIIWRMMVFFFSAGERGGRTRGMRWEEA